MTNQDKEVIRRIITLGLSAHTRHQKIKRGATSAQLDEANKRMAESAELLTLELIRHPESYPAIIRVLFNGEAADELLGETP